mmetsp:Transcript_10720/g.16173  ORF Transcript_10720/g.16173 Transcript_10720/m.16173 type:complete len:343 (-) Transcript_10720:934-1962(-)
MVFKTTLWNTPVELDLDKETFPTDEEIKATDELLFNPEHGFFEEANHGLKLHFQKWLPIGEPKGICVFHHGIQANGSLACKINGEIFKVACMAKSMREAGYILYSLDMLGHGFSEGKRFYIPDADWTINRDDLASFVQHIYKNSNLPLFLSGESYGACLTIHVARQWMEAPDQGPSNFKGICLLAPAIIADLPPPPIVAFLTVLANNFPTHTPFFMPNPVSADRIWDNVDVANEFTSDRRREMQLSAGGKKLCLGTALGVVNALETVREVAIPGLNVPFYVGHGTKDYGVPMAGTEYLLEHASTPEEDRCVDIIENAYHDLLSSEAREKILDSIINWMNNRN